jgi:hypothetical protein
MLRRRFVWRRFVEEAFVCARYIAYKQHISTAISAKLKVKISLSVRQERRGCLLREPEEKILRYCLYKASKTAQTG